MPQNSRSTDQKYTDLQGAVMKMVRLRTVGFKMDKVVILRGSVAGKSIGEKKAFYRHKQNEESNN